MRLIGVVGGRKDAFDRIESYSLGMTKIQHKIFDFCGIVKNRKKFTRLPSQEVIIQHDG